MNETDNSTTKNANIFKNFIKNNEGNFHFIYVIANKCSEKLMRKMFCISSQFL